MVVKRRIDIDDTDADYMDGDEEEDVFFGDHEISNEFQAPTLDQTMVNPVRTRRAAGFKVAWEAPASRRSWLEHAQPPEGRCTRPVGWLEEHPFFSLRLRHPCFLWTQYINNMSAADVAAELSAEVSEFEKALYLFAKSGEATSPTKHSSAV